MGTRTAWAFSLFLCAGLAGACVTETEDGSGGSGGSGASGATGGSGGSTDCEAGTTQACYSGDADTADVGMCVSGTQSCAEDGTWGACEDEVLPGTEDCYATGDEDCDGIACSDNLWGITGAEIDWVWDTAVDSAGNTIISVTINDALTLGTGTFTPSGTDILLAKIDPAGEIVWIKQLGGTGNQQRGHIAIGPDDSILVTGVFQNQIDFNGGSLSSGGLDIFLAKLDAAGAHVWSTRLGSSTPVEPTGNKEAYGVAVTPSGEIVVAGSNSGHWGGCNPCTSADGVDAYVRIFDGDGNQLHAEESQVAGVQLIRDVLVAGDGTIYVAGRYSESLDLGGSATATGNTGTRAFVAQLNEDGVGQWAVDLDPSGSDNSRATTLGMQSDGTIIVGGFFDSSLTLDSAISGADDFYVAAINASGQWQWSKIFDSGDGGFPELWSLAVDGNDDIVLGGAFSTSLAFDDESFSGPAGSGNAYLIKLNAAGEHLWSKAFTTDDQYSTAGEIAVAADGRISVAGIFDGTIDFGTGPVTSTATQHTLYISSYQP